ncbi:MAG TPA: zinc-binding dehydrogenase [Candidatus Limnocylindrales bacterium]|nr:zinc-binding dehydrogenase [Candidatus Limnocylindrales bacterium]
MRAALIERYGEPPAIREVDDPLPTGRLVLVEVRAAGLNPADLSIASGKFYAGSPPTPYIPGSEGVGIVIAGPGFKPGTRVYFEARREAGALAEKTLIEKDAAVELPDAVDDGTALALGIAGTTAWLSLEQRAQLMPGETVLVLAASGVLGMIAVQAARIMGAKRIVAAARDAKGLERARARGADAVVDLKHPDGLVDAFREAAGGGVDVVIDPLWGPPAAAAMQALNRFGRHVQLGQSAGAEATLLSSVIRGRTLSILGYTTFAVPLEVRLAAYRRMVAEVAAGRLAADIEVLPLDAVADAWRRQAQSPHAKLVLRPR